MEVPLLIGNGLIKGAILNPQVVLLNEDIFESDVNYLDIYNIYNYYLIPF